MENTNGIVGEGAAPAQADAVYRKVKWRLVPFLMACYVVAYLDRVNVGFAKLGMSGELGISEAAYGLGAGIFFIGYFLFEIPSNMALHRFGARRWIARIMISWAVVSAGCAFIEGEMSFYILRFLLGVAEAGFFPGIILYLSYWFPSSRRGEVIALFMVSIPLAGIVGGPLSGLIMEGMDGIGGWGGWRWMFVIEALPAVVLGCLVPRMLPSRPAEAEWLDDSECAWIERDLAADEPEGVRHHARIRDVFGDPQIMRLALIYFGCIMGQYGFTFWLPTMIDDISGGSPLVVGLFSVLPYACAAVVMLLVGRSSDRTGERRWHLILPLLVGAAALIVTPMAQNPVPAIALLCLAAASTLTASPLFWNLPTAFLRGSAAAVGIAAINSVGNLAGFASPLLIGWISGTTGSRATATAVLALILIVAAIAVFAGSRSPAKAALGSR